MQKECSYDYSSKCTCSEDDKCGCTYDNNMAHGFTCNFEEKNMIHAIKKKNKTNFDAEENK